MIKFFLCDSDLKNVQSLCRSLEKVLLKEQIEGKIVLATQKPNRVLEKLKRDMYNSTDCNVYLLDVDLESKMSGIELAKRIRLLDPIGYIIFITTRVEYGLVVYKHFIKAIDYMIKPISNVDFERVIKYISKDYGNVIDRIRKCISSPVLVRSGYNLYSLKPEDIVVIERNYRKTIIYTNDGTYTTSYPIKKYENDLYESQDILRIHRSYLINKNAIAKVDFEKMEVLLSNGLVAPIARNQKKYIKKVLK